jgi:FkbM family methyltransferase
MFIERWAISLAKPLVERFPTLATTYRTVRDELAFVAKPQLTPWGFKLAGNTTMAEGRFEPTETELIRNILSDVDILVNVGANVGYYCCHALAMGKLVIAFEPVEKNIRYLCRNLKANGWVGAEIYPLALSSTVGILELYGAGTGASVVKGWAGISENYVTLVPSSTMDLVLGTRLGGKQALIVVDVEGSEKMMIEGATIMLRNRPKPIWVVEIVTTQHQPRGVKVNPFLKSTFELFFENGYRSFTFDREMRPVTAEYIDSVLNGRDSFPTYNFMFCE